jgi:hypothetical protein
VSWTGWRNYSPRLTWKIRPCHRSVAGFPPRRTGFEPGVSPCGVCGGRSGTEARFLPTPGVLRFPQPVIPLTAQRPSTSISGAGTIGQIGRPTYRSELSLTPRRETAWKISMCANVSVELAADYIAGLPLR